MVISALGGSPKNLDSLLYEIEECFDSLFKSLCNLTDQYNESSNLLLENPLNQSLTSVVEKVQLDYEQTKKDTLEQVANLEGLFSSVNPLFLSRYGIDRIDEGVYSWDATFPPLSSLEPESRENGAFVTGGLLVLSAVSISVSAYLFYQILCMKALMVEQAELAEENAINIHSISKLLCESKPNDTRCFELLTETKESVKKAKEVKEKAIKLKNNDIPYSSYFDRILKYAKYGAIAYVGLKAFSFVNDWRKNR